MNILKKKKELIKNHLINKDKEFSIIKSLEQKRAEERTKINKRLSHISKINKNQNYTKSEKYHFYTSKGEKSL